VAVCCEDIQTDVGLQVMPQCLTVIFSLYNNALPNTGVSCEVSVRMDVVELFQ